MDVYGKNATTETGRYFRNNVWWWRPLADYITTHEPELSKSCACWQSNNGDGLDAEKSIALAEALQKRIDADEVKEYEARLVAELAALPDEDCWLCNGTGKRTDMTVTNGCDACQGSGKLRPDAVHCLFSVDNVQQFVNFLRECGGFEIC